MPVNSMRFSGYSTLSVSAAEVVSEQERRLAERYRHAELDHDALIRRDAVDDGEDGVRVADVGEVRLDPLGAPSRGCETST